MVIRSAIASFVTLEANGKQIKAWISSYYAEEGKKIKLQNSTTIYTVKEVRMRCPRRLVIDQVYEVESER